MSCKFVLRIKEDNIVLQGIQRDTDIDYQLLATKQICNISIFSISNTSKDIKVAYKIEETYKEVLLNILSGFPKSRHESEPGIMESWEVQDSLTCNDDIAFMDQRLVIPKALCKQILHSLHSTHQPTK